MNNSSNGSNGNGVSALESDPLFKSPTIRALARLESSPLLCDILADPRVVMPTYTPDIERLFGIQIPILHLMKECGYTEVSLDFRKHLSGVYVYKYHEEKHELRSKDFCIQLYPVDLQDLPSDRRCATFAEFVLWECWCGTNEKRTILCPYVVKSLGLLPERSYYENSGRCLYFRDPKILGEKPFLLTLPKTVPEYSLV